MINYTLEFTGKCTNINYHYLNRYLYFIHRYKTDSKPYEKHHILPQAIFPEFKCESDNIILLPLRVHYLAHYMLAKAIGGKMWFAFRLMYNTTKYNSKLYEYNKNNIRYISEVTSRNKMSYINENGESEAIRRSKLAVKTKQIIQNNGLTIFENASIKTANYLKNNFDENGISLNELRTRKMMNTKYDRNLFKIAGDKISLHLKTVDEQGKSVAHYKNIKRGETLKNNFNNDGVSLLKLSMKQREITMTKKNEEGNTIREIIGQKISNHLNTVEENGLTVAKNKGIKLSKYLLENDTHKGYKNGRALHIIIYDNDNTLRYDCKGNYIDICDKNKLPRKSFKKSFDNNGSPLIRKDFLNGWYAIKL